MAFYMSKATYKSNTYSMVLVIDIVNAKIVKEIYSPSTSYSFTLYLSSLLRKIACRCSNDDTTYTIFGMDENSNFVSYDTNSLPGLFSTEMHKPIGTERYKIYPQGSSAWYLYDYKGGFVE